MACARTTWATEGVKGEAKTSLLSPFFGGFSWVGPDSDSAELGFASGRF